MMPLLLTIEVRSARTRIQNGSAQVTVDGADVAAPGGIATVQIDKPTKIVVSAGTDVWEQTIEVSDDGVVDANPDVEPTIVTKGARGFSGRLVVHLSPFRDASAKFNSISGDRVEDDDVSKAIDYTPLAPDWAPPAPLAFAKWSKVAHLKQLILERKANDAPRAFYVGHWDRLSWTTPVPTLLFFHASFKQKTDVPLTEANPWGIHYVKVLNRYVRRPHLGVPRYSNDRAIPFQVAVARRAALVIVPLGSKPRQDNEEEMGALLRPRESSELLGEIVAFLARRAGVFRPPTIGRLAVAGFSSGNSTMTRFLTAHHGHSLERDWLREVYALDPLADGHATLDVAATVIQALRAWRSGTAVSDFNEKRVRIYYQGRSNVPKEWEASWDSGGGRFTTLAQLPPSMWERFVLEGPMKAEWRNDRVDFTHQLIGGSMLTHALGVSGFPSTT